MRGVYRPPGDEAFTMGTEVEGCLDMHGHTAASQETRRPTKQRGRQTHHRTSSYPNSFGNGCHIADRRYDRPTTCELHQEHHLHHIGKADSPIRPVMNTTRPSRTSSYTAQPNWLSAG